MKSISHLLIDWFERSQRILPWRENTDAYRVWISEIMLQQTRVQSVIPYFERFLVRFPNIQVLADSSLEDVLHAWQGLGYYSRARNLHKTAVIIQSLHGGIFPTEYAKIVQLPGIGNYTASAILSIAYGLPYPVVDGNVMRVIARLYAIQSDIRNPDTIKQINENMNTLFLPDHASAFNQGMMELGALICTPGQPKCSICPLRESCHAYQNGNPGEFPFKSTAPKPTLIRRSVFLIRNGRKILIHQRPAKGLLASMWEFPGVDGIGMKASALWKETYSREIVKGKKLLKIEHQFTHRIWKMDVYEAKLLKSEFPEGEGFRFVEIDALDDYPIPTAFRAIVEYLREQLKV